MFVLQVHSLYSLPRGLRRTQVVRHFSCERTSQQGKYSNSLIPTNDQKQSSPFRLWAVRIVQYGEIDRWSLVGIKIDLLLSDYKQLRAVQYGEIGRWSRSFLCRWSCGSIRISFLQKKWSRWTVLWMSCFCHYGPAALWHLRWIKGAM